MFILTSAAQAAGKDRPTPPSPSPSASPSCDPIIKACDKALDAKNKQIKLSDLAIQQQKDVINKQGVVIAEQDAKLNSFFRSPIVLIVAGAVGALLLGKLVK